MQTAIFILQWKKKQSLEIKKGRVRINFTQATQIIRVEGCEELCCPPFLLPPSKALSPTAPSRYHQYHVEAVVTSQVRS